MKTRRTSARRRTTRPAPALRRLAGESFSAGSRPSQWKADDDNNDELSYDVFYRREGDTTWRTLKSDLRDTLLVWDTSSVPNGTYVLKVLASDRKSNPADTALGGELESSSFEIDNVAPVGADWSASQGRHALHRPGRDPRHRFRGHEGRVFARRAALAAGVSARRDSRRHGRKAFEIRLDADAAGRTLVIRATDALGNVGTGQVQIQ